MPLLLFPPTPAYLLPSGTAIFAELDLGSFEYSPYMAVHLADHLKLSWSSVNIASIVWSLVGVDGSRTVVSATSGVSLAKPRGDSLKYAVSYGIDNGNGQFTQVGSDTGAHASDGISLLTMADAERVNAFLMAPGSTYAKLRVDIGVADASQPVTFSYPEFTRSEGTTPDLVWESGQVADVLYKDNAGIRFGNSYWYDGALLSTPAPRGLGKQQTLIDGLVNSRIWFTAQAKDDGLDAALAALYDTVEGQTQELCDSRTSSVILPEPQWGRIQYAGVNELAEVPPCALFPRRERDSDWAEVGDWCLDAWSWCDQYQHYTAPGSTEMRLKTPDGATTLTSTETALSGWSRTKRNDAVDNTESDDYLVFYGSEERGQASPWLGYFGIFGLSPSSGAVSYDVSMSMRHVRAYIEAGLVWVGTASNSPLPLAFVDRLTTLAADWMCVRWNLNTGSQQTVMAVELAGSIKIVESKNLFATWALTGHVVTGTKPTLVVSDSGRILMYYIDGGSAKVKVYSQTLSLIDSATLMACDDEGLAAYEQPKTGGGREVVLIYSSGGSVYRAVSPDGLTFGAGSVIGSGVKPLSFRGESGRHSEGWIDGSDIKARTVDRTGTVVVATNTVGNADDSGADIAQSTGLDGQARFVVLYSDGGSLTQKYSFDSGSWT